MVSELVQEIYEAGYFDNKVSGNTKNIVIKLEAGSKYPDDDYEKNGYIGEKKAKELALAQFHLSAAEFRKQEYDLDDGVYELEFTANGVKYEAEVDAVSGKVVEADREHNDDWKNDDRFDDHDDDDVHDDND